MMASTSLAAAWLLGFLEWLHEHQTEIWLAIVFAILAAFGVEPAIEFARKHWGLFEKTIERGPDDIAAESLVDGVIKEDNVRDLLKAINWGALSLMARTSNPAHLLGLSPIAAAWRHTSFEEHVKVAASFITPRCVVAAVNGQPPMGTDDALAVLREWLEDSSRELHGEIRGDTGVGKTTLLHQLFVDLAKSSTTAVPMLASADNINQNSDELERLKQGGDHISAFVSVWLKNRHVFGKKQSVQKAIVRVIGKALRNGDITLLLDGVDELKQKGAEDFVEGLLGDTKRWIVTRRYETSVRQGHTGNVIILESSWSRQRILQYACRQLASRPEAALRVESVLSQVIPEKGTSSHWLSHPNNLRSYVDEVASSNPPASEPELYHLAESATGLMEKLVERDMRHIDGADPTAIREALTILALCKPGDSRALRDGPLGKTIAGLRTLLRRDGNSLVFRHAAEAEYFLALRLASELLDPPSNLKDAEALQTVASQSWGSARLRLVDESLRSLMPVASDRADRIAEWLRPSSPADFTALLGPHGKRNVLEVWRRTRSENTVSGGPGTMQHLNLDEMEGQGLDLKNERIENCTFVRADLRDSEMIHAQFFACEFTDADLRGAAATGASFHRCLFGEGDQLAKLDGFEIEGAEITPPELEAQLVAGGARSQRSRYRGKFGEQFLRAQRAFLGRAAGDLENKSYLPAIQSAIAQSLRRRPGEALFLIDLMAGGYGGRSEELLAQFPLLHILSIDRDAPQRILSERHQWINLEFGAKPLAESGEADPVGLSSLLLGGFPESRGKADVVIGKKAFHELEHRAQVALMQSCAAALHAQGHLILFVDAPGPEIGPPERSAHEEAVQRHEQLRKILLTRTSQPSDVKKLIDAGRYAPDLEGEWLFVNDWIAIKDWANLNRHELAHRYFASIAEIREWATPWFGESVEVKIDWYDINPLRFNERGVNWVLHFLERNKSNCEVAVSQHRAMLAERLAGSEAFRTLVDITRAILDAPSEFARMMKATRTRIQLSDVEPLLAALERTDVAPQFKMKCAVITFERRSRN